MEIDMYGVFGQSAGGLVWLGNGATLEEAHAERQEINSDNWDFIMIIKMEAFYDLDGARE